MIYRVPSQFQPKHPLKYPPDNHTEFERWFHLNFRPTKNIGRTYLPIYWTAYYCKNGYGTRPNELAQLQRFIDTLPEDKYFTICQYDDGILMIFQRKIFAFIRCLAGQWITHFL